MPKITSEFSELSWPEKHPNIVCGYSTVHDYSIFLSAAERRVTASAVDNRRFEFATGRWLVHHALAKLDLDIPDILSGPRREPLWPKTAVGSIAHSDCYALAAVSRSTTCLGLGVDLARIESVDH